MASILRVNTLTDASSNNSTAMSTVFNGTAKVWGHLDWNGGLSLEDNFNVSSVSDDGAGDFGINFSSALSNDNYAHNTLSYLSSGITYVFGWELVKATSSANLRSGRHYNGSTTVAEDPTFNDFTIHGDLA